jgi:HEAT repeat protein
MRIAPPLCLLLLAGTAAADSVDVDGDGKLDTVRIDPTGAVSIERAGGGGAFVPFGLTGTLGTTKLTSGGKGRPYVVAVAQIGNGWEGVALRWDKGAMKEVWRGPLGPAGDDGEYEVWIEARASGLVRWQRRRDLDRCDGAETELFRESWDEGSRTWKAARPSVRFPDSTATVKAVASPALGAGWYRASGATTAAGAGDAGQLVAPRVLDDGNPATTWREDRGGDGTGEMFTFRTTMKGGRAAAVRVVPGATSGNRVRALHVIGKGATYRVELPDVAATEPVVATLPAPIEGCVTIAIAAVDRKGAANVTSIAELAVIADVELAPGGAETLLAQQVAKVGIAGDSAARALAGRGAPAVKALSELLAKGDATTRPRILAALGKIHDPAVIAPVAEALSKGDIPSGDRKAAAEMLASLGPDGERALTDVLANAKDEDGRLAVARVLAKTQPARLLDVAGQGSRSFRAAIVELLAGAGITELRSAASAWGGDVARPLPARADVFRAMAKAASAPSVTAEQRAATAKSMFEALEGWSSADATGENKADELYELHYRLVAGVGAIGGSAEIRGLAAWLGRAGDSARTRALKRVAANALGNNGSADARLALANLAADKDAGTRLAAVRALASDDGEEGDGAIATVLSTDVWPELRRAAASALGVRCQRRGPRDALDTALERDADLDVRIDSLTALVTCKADGIAARLLQIADNGKAEPDLRDRAIALYGQLGAKGATQQLLDRLDRWRGQAFSDESALRLAVRAVTALGVLGDGHAASAIMSAARDGAFPELQAAAATALGALGKACPRDAIVLLRGLAQSEQRSVSIAAKGAVKKCGR